VICGRTLRHTAGHVYRALLEATAFSVRHNLEVFAAAAARPGRTVAVGGGTRGALWTQIVSDVTGVAGELPEQTIGAAYGNAYLAAVGVGLADPNRTWARPSRTVEPDAAAGARYDELYGLYRDLHDATRATQHALAAIGLGSDSRAYTNVVTG